MNARLGLKTPDSVRVLRKEDILVILKTLLELKDGRGEIDDIDNLGIVVFAPLGSCWKINIVLAYPDGESHSGANEFRRYRYGYAP